MQLACAGVTVSCPLSSYLPRTEGEHSFIEQTNHHNLATGFYFHRFLLITNSFHGDLTMHRILAVAGALGLLALPMLASAQSTNQPATKNETVANPGTSTNKAADANTTKKAANKGNMKRQAQVTKNKRFAMHGHKMRSVKATHGKRFAKSHSRHRHVYGFSAGKSMHRSHHRHRVAYRGGCR
jgi:hypothetical protein